jgi:N-acetylneuraminate lyase
MTNFEGILPAVVTPFDRDGDFSPKTFERLLGRLYAAGVDGVYVCGQTGEGMLQPVERRKRVAEVALGASPAGKLVIVNTGANNTADALELSRHAARAGAHAVSSLPPVGGYSFAEIRGYYEALAAAVDVPVLGYYFPEICPNLVGAGPLLDLLSIPNLAGFKFTDFDTYTLSVVKESGAIMFNGRDEVLAAGLLMGADGGIGSFYNLVPELFVELWRLARANQWLEARAVQKSINELITLVLRFPLLPAIKAMLGWTGLDCGPCLAPRGALTREQEATLRRALAGSGFADTSLAGVGAR